MILTFLVLKPFTKIYSNSHTPQPHNHHHARPTNEPVLTRFAAPRSFARATVHSHQLSQLFGIPHAPNAAPPHDRLRVTACRGSLQVRALAILLCTDYRFPHNPHLRTRIPPPTPPPPHNPNRP